MSEGRQRLMRKRGASAVLLAVVLTASALVLLTVAASSGVVRVWTDPPVTERRTEVDDRPDEQLPVVDLSAGDAGRDIEPPDTWWWRVVVILVLVALALIAWIVVSVYWQLLRVRFERRPKLNVAQQPPTIVEVEREVSIDLDAGLVHLQHGEVRNAIVACWAQLEDDVAAAGVPRSPAETSVEYTQRVLASASVDASATLELAELYREARFSDHPVDDDRRIRAIESLRRVHASLRTAQHGGVA